MKYDITRTALVSDVDGTLLPVFGTVADEDRDAITEYIRRGGNFCLASGRAPAMLSLAGELGANIPCIVTNGAAIYDCAAQKTIWERFLDPRVFGIVPKVLERFPGLCFEFMALSECSVISPNEQFYWHMSWEHEEYRIVKPSDLAYNYHKTLLVGPHDVLVQAREFLRRGWDELFDTVFSCDVFLEILPKNCTKGGALRELRRILSGRVDFFMAMGDQDNDLAMLREADYSGCPSTATDAAKELCDEICAPVGRGAVADFLRRAYEKYIRTGR